MSSTITIRFCSRCRTQWRLDINKVMRNFKRRVLCFMVIDYIIKSTVILISLLVVGCPHLVLGFNNLSYSETNESSNLL